MIKTEALRRRERRQALLTVVFTIISVIYLMPVLLVLINSLKANAFVNTETFKLPTAESFVGLKNYVKGMTFGNFAFYKVVFYSFFITITSTALILLCTSMAAWYISRVGSLVSKIVYYLCVFSMVVPFQMVMYTLARTADRVHLNTPWTIPVVYLGFGAGLAVFMFTGFVKSLPLEIEEAAAIDGCGPLRTYFSVVFPMLRPTMISVGILEIMWVWNDYLLPLSRARQHQVQDHSHPYPVPQGQLRHGRSRRDDGAHLPEHRPRHHLLPLLPETHHQGRRGRRRERLISHESFLRHSDADLFAPLALRHRHVRQGGV